MKVKAVRPWPFWIIHLRLVLLYTPGSTLLTQPGKNLQRTMETEYMDSDQKDNTDVCSIMRTPLRFWMVVYIVSKLCLHCVYIVSTLCPHCEDPAEVLDGGLQTAGPGQKWLLLPITTRFGRDTACLRSGRSYNWVSFVFVSLSSLVFVCWYYITFTTRFLVSLWSKRVWLIQTSKRNTVQNGYKHICRTFIVYES